MANNVFLPPSPVTPPFLLISAITQSNPMVITVTTANSYVVGQLVHLSVPASYGMVSANQLTGEIIAINGLAFSVDINSTQFDAFSIPATFQERPASLSSAGSRNIYNIANVPFHSLGNTGN